MFPPPVVLAWVVCEKIVVEEGTKNLILVSTFSKLVAEAFPLRRPFSLYAVLTDGLGTATIEVVISSLDSEDVIYELQRPLNFPDRIAEVQALFRVNDCTFPEPGKYQICLRVDGEAIALRNLRVVQRGEQS